MFKVVSNTTPIISLLKLERLDLLKDLFGQIYIPLAVLNEVNAGKDKNYFKDLSKIDWIVILEIKDKASVGTFQNLDAGEAEAIVLATEICAGLIILDEKLGRSQAKKSSLNVIGTIGILLKAKKMGLIANIEPLLEELTIKNVWISDDLKNEILSICGER